MTQNEQIKQHLEKGNSITPMLALQLCQCFRLASRIKDLRNKGMIIEREMVLRNGKRFAKYFVKSLDKK